mgnify:FL=1
MNFDAIFYPKAIAIIGASSREKTVGNDVVKNLVRQGYAGKIYPVNPKIEELYGLKVFASIEEINDDEIELLVLAIPAKFVAAEIEKAASKGVKAAIVISAGFKEAGNLELEKELARTCNDLKITLVGPNCLGAINAEIQMNASFASVMPPVGDVAFMSQSGALCTAVLDYAKDLGIGFSKFISIGNKAALNELDLIKYLHADKKTKVICMYAESLENAPEIIEVLRQLNRGRNPKPIIVLKSGKTTAGAGAIASHTGSLSSGDSAYQALFTQAGIIRANSVSELFDLAQMFSMNDLQKVNQVSIVTNAGGPGVLTTDAVIENHLEMAVLTPETVKTLRSFLPTAASTHNPVDVLGDAVGEVYKKTLEVLARDKNTDGIIVLLTPQSMTEPEATAQAIVEMRRHSQKPIIVSLMGKKLVAEGVNVLREQKIATTAFPEPAAIAMAKFAIFNQWAKQKNEAFLSYDEVDKAKVIEIFARAKAKSQTSFPEAEAMKIMKAYKFPLLKSAVAKSSAEAVKIMQEFKCEVAMKIVSPDILHKSDVGGVSLGVTLETIESEYKNMMERVAKKMPKAKLEGVLLMEMANKGTELILGINKNSLGTTLMFGLGGIYVEVFKDVNFAFTPITREDALKMINGLRSSKLLDGVRGEKPVDKELLIEILGRLAQLVNDFKEIVELDINPLLVNSDGVKVLDARVVIE